MDRGQRRMSRRIPMAQTEHRGVSRRKALLTGAGLFVAGAAGGVLATQLADGSLAGAPKSPKLPVMVYLRDHGDFDVFVGNRNVRLSNPGFAAQLAEVAEQAA